MIPKKILSQIEQAARDHAGKDQPEAEHGFLEGANFGFNLSQELIEEFVDEIEMTVKCAAHVCPNTGINFLQECILCIALEKLNGAMASYRAVITEQNK